jgi:hypothetical protein
LAALPETNPPTLPSSIILVVPNNPNQSILRIPSDALTLISSYLNTRESLKFTLTCERLAILFGATRYYISPLELAKWFKYIATRALERRLSGTDLINLKRMLDIRTANPVARLFMILSDARITFPAPETIPPVFYGHKIYPNGFRQNQCPYIYSECYHGIIK